MATLQKFKDHYIWFCEAGFIAVNQADEDSAIKLFKAAELLDPDNFLPKVGMGYLHLFKLELRQACKYFDEVLQKDPNNDMARTFLGLSLALSPTEVAQGEKLLEESIKKSHDPMIKHLAEDSIKFVDTFVKKPQSPVHVQPKQEKKKGKK